MLSFPLLSRGIGRKIDHSRGAGVSHPKVASDIGMTPLALACEPVNTWQTTITPAHRTNRMGSCTLLPIGQAPASSARKVSIACVTTSGFSRFV